MFRCCRTTSPGTWRSAPPAILAAALLAWALMLAPAQPGLAPPSQDAGNRALELFTITAPSLWVAIGLADGKRRGCRAVGRDPK